MTCRPCGNRGLLKICYESGEPWDVAICQCRTGQLYRQGGPDLVRARLEIADEHRIALLEDFEDDVEQPRPTVDVAQAGKVKGRMR